MESPALNQANFNSLFSGDSEQFLSLPAESGEAETQRGRKQYNIVVPACSWQEPTELVYASLVGPRQKHSWTTGFLLWRQDFRFDA